MERRHSTAMLGFAVALATSPVMVLWGGCSAHLGPRSGGSTAVASSVNVTFVGDSITAGGQWQQAFPRLTITNQGVRGDATRDVLARLPRIRATGAHTYLLMVGINDILRGETPTAIAPRILRIRRELAGPGGGKVLVQSVLPCQRAICGEAVLRQVAELNRLLEASTPAESFIDLSAAMSDASGGLRASDTSDGLHLNPAGYRRWEAQLAPHLDPLVPAGDDRFP
jgi:lysophospholipase L1-like esterase